jgi:hypothetical protein
MISTDGSPMAVVKQTGEMLKLYISPFSNIGCSG